MLIKVNLASRDEGLIRSHLWSQFFTAIANTGFVDPTCLQDETASTSEPASTTTMINTFFSLACSLDPSFSAFQPGSADLLSPAELLQWRVELTALGVTFSEASNEASTLVRRMISVGASSSSAHQRDIDSARGFRGVNSIPASFLQSCTTQASDMMQVRHFIKY